MTEPRNIVRFLSALGEPTDVPARSPDANVLPTGPRGAKGSAGKSEPREGKMGETSNSSTVSTRIERIAKLARELPGRSLTTLAHHIDMDWLREAYRRTRKDGARGVDGQSAERLEENLQSLLDRAKAGTYRAPPVRRVHIPKGTGRKRGPSGMRDRSGKSTHHR